MAPSSGLTKMAGVSPKPWVLLLKKASDEPFRFLDLPPELRNRIYRYLLKEGRKKDQLGVTRIQRARNRRIQSFEHGDHSNRTFVQLLQSCRQVNEEAASVLYGTTVFEFGALAHVTAWLRTIGPMRKHIRHVVFKVGLGTTARPALHLLKDAVRIASLHIQACRIPHSHRGVVSVQQAAVVCAPFIKALMRAKSSDAERSEVLSIVRGFFERDLGDWGNAQIELFDTYASEIREELKKILKMADE